MATERIEQRLGFAPAFSNRDALIRNPSSTNAPPAEPCGLPENRPPTAIMRKLLILADAPLRDGRTWTP